LGLNNSYLLGNNFGNKYRRKDGVTYKLIDSNIGAIGLH
jgi:hypothetical protein